MEHKCIRYESSNNYVEKIHEIIVSQNQAKAKKRMDKVESVLEQRFLILSLAKLCIME